MTPLPIYINDVASVVRWHRRVQRLGGPGVHCERCGESHPFTLKRGEAGEVLCYVCRALERAVPASEEEQSKGEARECAFCGFLVPHGLRAGALLHVHHIAGRNHDARSVTPCCLNCHSKLHEVLRALGVDLRRQSDPRDTKVNALLAEIALVPLAWEETPTRMECAPLAMLFILSVVVFVVRLACLPAEWGSAWSS